jgi:hypothetical protein
VKRKSGAEPHRGSDASQQTRPKWACKPTGGRFNSKNKNEENTGKNKEKEDPAPPSNQEGEDLEERSRNKEEHARPEDMLAWVAV